MQKCANIIDLENLAERTFFLKTWLRYSRQRTLQILATFSKFCKDSLSRDHDHWPVSSSAGSILLSSKIFQDCVLGDIFRISVIIVASMVDLMRKGCFRSARRIWEESSAAVDLAILDPQRRGQLRASTMFYDREHL